MKLTVPSPVVPERSIEHTQKRLTREPRPLELAACAQPYNPGSISHGPSVIDQASGQGVKDWPSPFFCVLIDGDEVEVNKNAKTNKVNIHLS